MRKLTMILFGVVLLFAGCETKELSREEASQKIKQHGQYPKIIDYDLYCSDPSHAKKAIEAGLEKEGLVSVLQIQKMADVGKPLIQFNAKAQPYLLSTPEKDKAMNVQKVKIADEDYSEITAIKTANNGKDAIVEYTTTYRNITPFSALAKINFSAKPIRKVYFSLTDHGWRLEK